MLNPPTTRLSLLVRLRDAHDADAWRQFVRLYGPVIYRFARGKHLQDADAADLTQEVLCAVSPTAGVQPYDPARGPFRRWLFGVAQHKLYDFLVRQQRQCQGSGGAGSEELLDRQPAREDEDRWDQEYQRSLFHEAAEQVRPGFSATTWQAFWQTAVDGRPTPEVAAALGLSVGAVYIAKSRVQARLKAAVRVLEADEEYEEGFDR